MHHVLNVVLKPWTVARSARPRPRNNFVRVISDIGRPGLSADGKTRSLPSRMYSARPSTSRACALSGTRCSAPDFMRSPGIVHVAACRSISAHVAPLASPDRAAVRTTNWKQSRVVRLAPESSMAAMHGRQFLIRQGPEVFADRWHFRQGRIYQFTRGVDLNMAVGHCEREDGPDSLP